MSSRLARRPPDPEISGAGFGRRHTSYTPRARSGLPKVVEAKEAWDSKRESEEEEKPMLLRLLLLAMLAVDGRER